MRRRPAWLLIPVLLLIPVALIVQLIRGNDLSQSTSDDALPSDEESEDSMLSDEQPPRVTYSAISDRNVHPYPPLPSLRGAGYQLADPAFGSKMLRVTDANTRPDRVGRAWGTPSSAETSAWNTDGSKFYVTGGGGEQLPYSFNPATMTASRMGDTSNESGGLVLLLRGEPSFSFVDPDLIYGGSESQIVSYRFSTATQTALHDVHSCLPGVAVRDLGLSVTKDDQRLLVYFGGSSQDLDTYVYVYDRTLGCRWLNTQTGQVGGQWGPTGTYTGDTGYFVHNARMSKNGKWARITAANNAQAGMYFWNIESLDVIGCNTSGTPHCGGHLVTGFNQVINNRALGDGMDFAIRSMRHVNRARPLIIPLLTPSQYMNDTHPSWNNVQPDEKEPVCMAAYRTDDLVQRPWDGEIICIETRPTSPVAPSTVWRFAHHRSHIVSFGDIPRANVSQDGRLILFTSNWGGTLGSQSAADGGGPRQDAFIVRLAPPNTLAAAPGGAIPGPAHPATR